MDNVIMNVAVSETDKSIGETKDIRDRLRQCMQHMQGHWLVPQENDQFKCAVVAAILKATKKEKEDILFELDNLVTLSMMITGTPQGITIDIDKIVEEAKKHEAYGLLTIWHEVKAGKKI